jgi:hypothetical protein
MQTSKLIGIWKLESNAGKQPVEGNIKTGLLEFKADGTFVDATETLGPCPGLLPGRTHRFNGAWKLEENILERTFPEGTFPAESFPEGPFAEYTHKTMVAINDDTLELAARQYDRKVEREFIGIFVYKRVNTS